MVRKAILLLVLCWPCGLVAQDIIVTMAMDTIPCRIVLVRDDRIHYVSEDSGSRRNQVIMKSDVYGYHQQGYLPVILDNSAPRQRVPNDYAVPGDDPVYDSGDDYTVYQRARYKVSDPVRLAFNAGWTWRTAKISEDLPLEWKEHYKGLIAGRQFGGGFTAFPKESFGIGAAFGIARWEHQSLAIPFPLDTGGTIDLAVRDRVSMGHISGEVVWRHLEEGSRLRLYSRLGAGFSWFHDEQAIDVITLVFRSSTINLNAGLGADVLILPGVAIGVDVEMIFGVFTEFKIEQGAYTYTYKSEKGQGEAAHRFNLSFGPRFIF